MNTFKRSFKKKLFCDYKINKKLFIIFLILIKMNCQRVSNKNNNNTNTILQIGYNRIIKLIEEPSENLSTKISTAETTLKRKIEGISYNVARVKEILIQPTQLNNNINNESPP